MNFDKIIKDLKAEKPKDREETQEIGENIKVFTLLKKIKEKKVKTKLDFDKVFGTLCFKSIAFCCGPSNPCLLRNAVLDALGISMKDYLKIKKKWNKEFISVFLKNTSYFSN